MVPHRTFDLLFTGLDTKTADVYCLVLSAKHIGYRCFKDAAGYSILVISEQLPHAKEQIQAYLKENPHYDPPPIKHRGISQQNYSMLWVAMVLIAIHWSAGAGARKQILITHFGASAEQILKGELFRCVTALTLHSDAAHLIANIGGLLLFGTVLCRALGTGTAWILILLGGSSGNLLNAFFHQTAHLSIGASTSVFSTLGSLSAEALLRRIEIPNQKLKAFLPLWGGLALLALLGADPETDVLAHLFGFSAGLLLAFIWVWVFPENLNNKAQWTLSLISTAIVLLSWKGVFYI